MHLRFEKNQLRIRVLQNEASLLLDHKNLTEYFPFSSSADPIQLHVEICEANFSFVVKGSILKLEVPRQLLQKKIQTSGRDPVCTLITNLNGVSTEIVFEVDVFKKKDDAKK